MADKYQDENEDEDGLDLMAFANDYAELFVKNVGTVS
jgi:hypothetical protein